MREQIKNMKKGTLILAASIISVLVTVFVYSRFFVDLLWFSSLGFRAVFITTWMTMLAMFVARLDSRRESCCSTVSSPRETTDRRNESKPQSFRIVGRGGQGAS